MKRIFRTGAFEVKLRTAAWAVAALFGFASFSASASGQEAKPKKEKPAAARDWKPDGVWVTPYCGVYHFDREYLVASNGRPMNESPDCIGLRVAFQRGAKTRLGFDVLDFNNSIYRRTTIAGVMAERALLGTTGKQDASCGIGGLFGVQVRKGYRNLPVLGNAYAYCQAGRLRSNVLAIPKIGKSVAPALIWSAEVRIF